jgi:3-polyprenyl-4-hydroxybenzoate decarboxylase
VKLFPPIFEMNFHEIMDIALSAEGAFHNLVFVSAKKNASRIMSFFNLSKNSIETTVGQFYAPPRTPSGS